MIHGERVWAPRKSIEPWLSLAGDGKNYNAVGKFYHFTLTPHWVGLSLRSKATLSDGRNYLIF